MKQTFKEAGYTHKKSFGDGGHILFNEQTKQFEMWQANKNHASYGLIYKNTHLEFCSSMERETAILLLK